MRKYLLIILISCATITAASAAALDTARIDQLTGLKGKFNEKEGVYKVTSPRNDVKVVVDGWKMPPFMGLRTWAAFTATRGGGDGDGRSGVVRGRSQPGNAAAREWP